MPYDEHESYLEREHTIERLRDYGDTRSEAALHLATKLRPDSLLHERKRPILDNAQGDCSAFRD